MAELFRVMLLSGLFKIWKVDEIFYRISIIYYSIIYNIGNIDSKRVPNRCTYTMPFILYIIILCKRGQHTCGS